MHPIPMKVEFLKLSKYVSYHASIGWLEEGWSKSIEGGLKVFALREKKIPSHYFWTVPKLLFTNVRLVQWMPIHIAALFFIGTPCSLLMATLCCVIFTHCTRVCSLYYFLCWPHYYVVQGHGKISRQYQQIYKINLVQPCSSYRVSQKEGHRNFES